MKTLSLVAILAALSLFAGCATMQPTKVKHARVTLRAPASHVKPYDWHDDIVNSPQGLVKVFTMTEKNKGGETKYWLSMPSVRRRPGWTSFVAAVQHLPPIGNDSMDMGRIEVRCHVGQYRIVDDIEFDLSAQIAGKSIPKIGAKAIGKWTRITDQMPAIQRLGRLACHLPNMEQPAAKAKPKGPHV